MRELGLLFQAVLLAHSFVCHPPYITSASESVIRYNTLKNCILTIVKLFMPVN